MTAPSPTVTPGITTAPSPTQAPAPTTIGFVTRPKCGSRGSCVAVQR